MASKVRLGDIGVIFKVRIRNEDGNIENLTTASTKQLIFRKPDGTSETKNASFSTDGSDGYIQYISKEGDLDVKGIWKLQAFIVLGGNEWHTTLSEFEVTKIL
jgi:hypothetical protein